LGNPRMGKIISSKKTKKNTIICQIEITKNELLHLKGEMKKIRFFSRKLCSTKECVKERGNGNTTKYIPIPIDLRPRRKNYKKLTCRKLEFPQGRFYIYGLLTR
jgi:DNA-binding Xre family transcriptional regulator